MDVQGEIKTTKGDMVHALTKGAIASIPVLGNYLSEAFDLLVTQPAEKRKENIILMMDERLHRLENTSIDLNSLAENELFLSSVLQATQIAMRTHQNDKLIALINSITNVATDISLNDSKVQMFLSFIDGFNEWHLRLLLFFDDPKGSLESKGLSSDFYMGGASSALYSYYPELKSEEEFTRQVINDLHHRGLLNSDAGVLNTMMTGSGIVASRTTRAGKEFLHFISEPDLIK
ncbi:hypothetical protein [Paenibacillus xylanilyticus]|uniref:Uncharacterized protein n=1 Tax=Paenibacillus xylanilyticus TaxID=248903 RepID=A0A7Y6EZW2_9BACL|nr:hypothetical protein [Paenibacillus xylanilyticus]NUU80065.1 hypothetical protein [Paenibacillus xylanilyticus]